MKRTTDASPARTGSAMPTKPRRRSALTALFAAAIALLLALPGFASANTLGEVELFKAARPGTVRQITVGPDGNGWFLGHRLEEPAIGRITQAGVVTEYVFGEEVEETETIKPLAEGTLGYYSELEAITPGPEGEKYLWFTDFNEEEGSAIGRIDTTNPTTVEEFKTGLQSESKPQGIVAGPEGNLWFTDVKEEEAAIGMINPTTHEIKEFKTGLQAESRPRGITLGADGNLWFVDQSPSEPAIGRINPSTHEIVEFTTGENSLPGASVDPRGPSGIATGGDGNVWFTEGGTEATEGRSATGKAIGRITPVGTITYFSSGLAASSRPYGLTAAPGGKLWFTDEGGFSERQHVEFKGSWASEEAFELCYEATCKTAKYSTSGSTLVNNIVAALNSIPAIGAGNVASGGPCGGSPVACVIAFTGEKAGTDMAQVACKSSGSGTCSAFTLESENGRPYAIGSVSTSGVITRHTIPALAGVTGIAAPSSGGYVWAASPTSSGMSKIVKFGIEPKAPPTLTVNFEEGTGSVVSNPAGLECGASAPNACDEGFETGTKITLTASPAPGYAFKSWKGCDSGGVNGRQCTVTLSTSKTVGAKFVKVWNLKGTKSIPNGIFGTSPGGVNCGYGCLSSSSDYKEGSLTLKAKPAKNFHFVEFTGGTNAAESCNGVTALECTIETFNADSAIEEVYAENAKNTLTLTKEGGGQGFIKTKPSNINCGYTCGSAKAEFFSNEEPEVSVTLNKGTTSITWVKGAGTCTGNALTCKVPMNAAHELVAKFN